MNTGTSYSVRVCLGSGAPGELNSYLERLGLEVVSFSQRQHASLYVDFVGARPPGVPVISLNLNPAGSDGRRPADFSTDNLLAAATYIFSRAYHLDPPFITADPDTFFCMRSALCVALSPLPVLIEGEVGTGKETLARLIHRASGRAEFKSINCATLGGGIPGDELKHFLHNLQDRNGPGGAGSIDSSDNDGRVTRTTIFVDEVGELSKAGQLLLLQMLLKAEDVSNADSSQGPRLRSIAASSVRLASLVERGEFRQDLYWRLNAFTIELPALRSRLVDVAILAQYFLALSNPKRRLSPAALRTLSHYPFPGNVRELKNLMSRLAIAPLEEGGHVVDVPDVKRHLGLAAPDEPSREEGSAWQVRREEARREMVLRTLASCGGNRAEAARRLGISLRALQYHITKAGLSRPKTRVSTKLHQISQQKLTQEKTDIQALNGTYSIASDMPGRQPIELGNIGFNQAGRTLGQDG